MTKKYKTATKKDFFALRNINLSFDQVGLISIVGKSGSGKTTLANIISFLDCDYEGSIYLDGKKISSLSKKEKNDFRDKNIGVVFQNYHLIENENVLYNVSLPLLIKGIKKEIAYEKARKLLKYISFPEYLYDEKVKNLSGGEKQRVSILRALIKEPRLIIADEPTGALDKMNSRVVLNLLKKISDKILIIIISHDRELVKKYSDRIIELKNGRLLDDEKKSFNKTKLSFLPLEKKEQKVESWTWRFSKNILQTNKIKNIVFFCVFTICFILTNTMFSLISGMNKTKINEPRRILNYTNFNISQKVTVPIEGTSFSLIKTSRLTNEQLNKYEIEYPDLVFEPVLNALFITENFLYLDKEQITISPLFSPVYSFDKKYLNADLFSYRSKEQFPSGIIINNPLFEILKKTVGKHALTKEYELRFSRDIVFYTTDDSIPEVVDKFVFIKKYKILGVVEEFSFMNEPQIYFSYQQMLNDLNEYILVNISNYSDRKITVVDYINECSSNDEMTSYSHHAFYLKNIDFSHYESVVRKLKNDSQIEIESLALNRKEAFVSLLEATNTAVDVLFAFVIIGALVIVGAIAYSSYVLNQKQNAILLSLGANKYHIFKIYSSITFVLLLLSFSLVKITDSLFMNFINFLIAKFLGIKEAVLDGSATLTSNKTFDNIAILVIGIFLVFIVSIIPLFFKKISLIEELKSDA